MQDTAARVCRPRNQGHLLTALHLAGRHLCATSTRACWALATLGVTLGSAALAQDTKPVYRCPGPPVLYTDGISPQEARDKGCRTIEGAPITIVQTPPRPRSAASGGAAGASAAPAPNGGSRPGDGKVDAAAQRARDTDRQRILTDELRIEEERLAALKKELNNGEPERRGDERNFQKYADRVAEMKAALARKEADIAALKRELAKLPQ
jgi:hypothetical protein